METETLQIISRKYILPTGDSAFYAGAVDLISGVKCFCFVNKAPAPDWFTLYYVPVKGASLQARTVQSQRRVYTESKKFPPMKTDEVIMEHIKRLQKQGAFI